MRRTVFIATSLLVFLPFMAAARTSSAPLHDSTDVAGYWYTQGHEGIIRLYRCDDKICGRFYWIRPSEAEDAALDVQNPDPAERDRPLCNMQFMGNFTPDGHGRYEDGWIYSPRDGQIYSANITQTGRDTIVLHGYLWLPLLGEDQTWTRARPLPPPCGERL